MGKTVILPTSMGEKKKKQCETVFETFFFSYFVINTSYGTLISVLMSGIEPVCKVKLIFLIESIQLVI